LREWGKIIVDNTVVFNLPGSKIMSTREGSPLAS
jgi:hypothetical protein